MFQSTEPCLSRFQVPNNLIRACTSSNSNRKQPTTPHSPTNPNRCRTRKNKITMPTASLFLPRNWLPHSRTAAAAAPPQSAQRSLSHLPVASSSSRSTSLSLPKKTWGSERACLCNLASRRRKECIGCRHPTSTPAKRVCTCSCLHANATNSLSQDIGK